MPTPLPETSIEDSPTTTNPMNGTAPTETSAEDSSSKLEASNADAPDDIPRSVENAEDSTVAAEAGDDTQPEPEPPKKKRKLCGVCEEKEGKYKCTRCFLPYCSIPCSTIHKTNHPTSPPPPSCLPTPPPSQLPTHPSLPPKPITTASQPGTLSFSTTRSQSHAISPFAPLATSSELRSLFEIYPSLRAQLEAIHEATLRPIDDSDEDNSPSSTRSHKRDSKFGSGRGRGGRGGRYGFRNGGGDRNGFRSGNGYRNGKEKEWTHDRGLENGVRVLNEEREKWGKEGEGVRAFGRVVLGLLEGRGADGNGDAGGGGGGAEGNGMGMEETLEDILRREVDSENRRVVERLLAGEM